MFGIDVSKWNYPIDWKKVAAQQKPKVDFVYIKATQGRDFIDLRFLSHANGATAAGLKVGYYHFASLNTVDHITDAKEEALDFIQAIKHAPGFGMPLVLDIEENKIKLNKERVASWIKEFFDTLKKNGYEDVVLYSYASFLNENLPINHGLAKYRLWLAGYVEPQNLKLPNGWKSFWLWQYSSTGRINGIAGNVDLNRNQK